MPAARVGSGFGCLSAGRFISYFLPFMLHQTWMLLTGRTLLLLLMPLALFALYQVYILFRRSKRIEDDLVDGFAESLSGPVESKSSKWWHIYTPAGWIEVDGKRIQLSSLDEYAELEPGNHISVEYLPRSRVAVVVSKSKKRGSVLGL